MARGDHRHSVARGDHRPSVAFLDVSKLRTFKLFEQVDARNVGLCKFNFSYFESLMWFLV
jgi:hypothetical protein